MNYSKIRVKTSFSKTRVRAKSNRRVKSSVEIGELIFNNHSLKIIFKVSISNGFSYTYSTFKLATCARNCFVEYADRNTNCGSLILTFF